MNIQYTFSRLTHKKTAVRFPIIGGIEKHEISLSLDLDNPSVLQKAIS